MRLDRILAKCRRGKVTTPSTRPNWRDRTHRCWAPTRQRQFTHVRVNESWRTWLGTNEAKVFLFIINIFCLLPRGDGNVTTELWWRKATHIVSMPYIACGWWRAVKYLTTIKRSLIGGFLQARLADIINQTRPTGLGNRRTTQFSTSQISP